MRATRGRCGVDRRVIVRGRVDHKERGETKLVVQEIEPFEPTAEEITAAGAPPADLPRVRAAVVRPPAATAHRRSSHFVLRVDARRLRRERNRGSEVGVRASSRVTRGCCSRWIRSSGPRRLRFGSGYRVSPTTISLLDGRIKDSLARGPDVRTCAVAAYEGKDSADQEHEFPADTMIFPPSGGVISL